MKIISVIPAYNEAQVLAGVIALVRPHVQDVVVVDDGSRDHTAQVAAAAGAQVVRHPINRGQGAALQTGMEVALALGADILVHFDSDGQHPAHQIAALTAPIINGEVDVVLGSRFLDDTSNPPLIRRIVLRVGAVLTRLLSGLRITDPHSGFRALSRPAAEKIRLRQDRMAHASEFLQLLARHELRYKEIPVTIRYTEYSMARGQSSWNAIKIVIDLIKGSLL
ncbi:MAG: glycosyltransferase family 2 protein [Parcubacteria group bacterium]|nr:glycosyltransferase family 2 protein [Parcubacteria group bacterium]